MLYTFFLLFILSWLTAVVPSQVQKTASPGFGSIRGRVLDGDEKPVSAAEVSVQSTDRGSSDILPVVKSDADGEFLITRVPAGRNVIFASKLADGYPDTMIGAFSVGVNVIPEVLVEEGKTTAGVIVHLAKGAILLGLVVNSDNNQPVIGARILILRDDDPQLFLSTRADMNGGFQFTIPAKPFDIQVSEPGYATWENGETAPHRKGPPILLSIGTRRELLVRLEKMKTQTPTQEEPKR